MPGDRAATQGSDRTQARPEGTGGGGMERQTAIFVQGAHPLCVSSLAGELGG